MSLIPDYESQFQRMLAASRREPPLDEVGRKALLRALRQCLCHARADLFAAVSQDFGCRSAQETLLAEVLPSMLIIHNALRNLASWMRPRRRGVALEFRPARNRLMWQPKGVVLIISPWNYPLNLVLGPLVAALAAGNRVVIKPSELSPATSDVLKHHLEATLGPDRVTVATGGVEVSHALCCLPFDHIFFTGSTAVGREIMRLASVKLTPVTLELGGKAPVIVHQDAELTTAARRIARGKLINAGQTCIAPDYVLIPRTVKDAFIERYRDAATALYPRLIDNPEYTSIISARHFDRIIDLAKEARMKGAKLSILDPAGELPAGQIGAANVRKIAPVILSDVTDDMKVMQEEIFGPLLPVVPYDGLDEAIAFVNSRPRPLSLYYFDRNRDRVGRVLSETVSGGVSVNDTLMHFAQADLPFGGIGSSGMGAYHGFDGFRTFSHQKGIFVQSRYAVSDWLTPPYGLFFALMTAFTDWRLGGRSAAQRSGADSARSPRLRGN